MPEPANISIELLPPVTVEVFEGLPGKEGPRGPEGPPGPKGESGDLHFVFTEGVPSTLWTVKHDLGKYPSVTVLDTAGDEVEGITTYVSVNELTILFSATVTGTAYLN